MSRDNSPEVAAFFHETTNTFSYVVSERDGPHAVVIDSVLDYDPNAGRTSHEFADRILEFVESRGLAVDWILETHVHADHLSAAPYLKERLGAPVAIGDQITAVQSIFKQVFNAGPTFHTDGSQFDLLLADNDEFMIGSLLAHVMHTPGHTPACVTYVIGDAVFVGDTLFMPDYGTARADFPGGDARTLYRSIRRILQLPPNTRVFLCHDYKAPGREIHAWKTTVAEQKESNIHVHDGVSEEDFVALRVARDRELDMPALILPSVQVNMRAGSLPPPEENGTSYLKIPVNRL